MKKDETMPSTFVIAVIARKGGSGKTTTATTLAGLLGLANDTALIDLDPQGSASWILNCTGGGSSADLILGKQVELTRLEGLKLEVAAGNTALEKVSMSRAGRLRKLPHKYVVVDTGSTLPIVDVLRSLRPDLTLVVGGTDPMNAVKIVPAVQIAQKFSRRVAVVANQLYPAEFANAVADISEATGEMVFGVRTDARNLRAYHRAQRPLGESQKSKICQDLKPLIRWMEEPLRRQKPQLQAVS